MVSAMGAGARSEDALAALLLTTRLGEVDEEPLSPAMFWSLVAAVPAPAELLATSAGDIARRTGLPQEESLRLARLLSGGTSLAFALERSERQGFVSVTPFDAAYPGRLRDRLGDQAPPVLFTVGVRELLSSEGIGVVGSRAVRPDAAAVAGEVAELAAADGRTVISGGARGVDERAMTAALGAGGHVVGYLADSLLRRVREPNTRRAVADGTSCLATPFAPSAPFSAANALGRNKLIYASAGLTLVVACDLDRGGTWEGAVQALRRGYGSVAAWVGPGAGPGNERLVELGAIPVDDPSAVVELPSPDPVTQAFPDQLRLGL
jgi:predicted Rossmann fold nucleotide-binding protein DprA/Smf involved in DNA uptake